MFALGGEQADKADAEVTAALKKHKGELGKAAKSLGMSYYTFYRLLKRKKGYRRIALLAKAGEI